MEDHREDDGEEDALLDTHADDDGGGDGCDHELVSAESPDLAHIQEIDELETDQEDDGRENGVRQVLQRLRQEEEDDRDDDGGRQLRHLRSTLGLVDHLGLGRAAVDDEGAA